MSISRIFTSIFSFLLLLSFAGCAHAPTHSSAWSSLPTTTLSPGDYAHEKLIHAGVSHEFADLLHSRYANFEKETDTREKVINLNIFGFLAHGDYSAHYSAYALQQTRKFIREYRKTLKLAENKYHVSKETISALLWVETKFGKHVGTFSLSQVYFSLLEASHPTVATQTLFELNNRKQAALQAHPEYIEKTLEDKVIERSIKKSDWALEQLKIMDQLYQFGMKEIVSTRSSYAGAFGYSQFIPKTYADFAVSEQHPHPDLFDMRDAILSVANYLNKKGWNQSDPKAQSDALFEYNRIRDYGDVIIKIAKEL